MATPNKIYIVLLIASLAAFVKNSEAHGTVYPTVNCIIDYSVYEAHKFNEQEIVEEFSYIWANVRELYRKINNPTIEIVYRGCQILKNKKESDFVMASLIGHGIINPEIALKTFGKYLSNQPTPVGRQANINVFFTNYRMCLGNCGRTNTVGLANVASACSHVSGAVGVIKVQEPHNTVHTVAHELAHMLGARHDGNEEASNCNSNDFIMSPSHGVRNDAITPDPLDEYKWSSCTVNMIRKFITKEGGQCLLDQSNNKNQVETKVDKRKPKNPLDRPTALPPKTNNNDVQTIFGNKFSFNDALRDINNECKKNRALGICMSAYADKNTCKPVVCEFRYKFRKWCRTLPLQLKDNSRCGLDKVCSGGVCVDMPVSNKSPYFGDNKSFYGNNNSGEKGNTIDIGHLLFK